MVPISETNSLTTSAIHKNGRVWISATCQTFKGNLGSYEIPYEYGMYWYPLSMYIDYSYETNWNKLLLSYTPETPKEIKDYFKIEGKRRTPFLKEFYDYEINAIGKDYRMYDMNVAITTKLKSIGLKTWDEFYNAEDVKNNFTKLTATMNLIENSVFQRERVNNANLNRPSNALQYATQDEQTMLMDLGMGYRMNTYMNKVVRAQNQY